MQSQRALDEGSHQIGHMRQQLIPTCCLQEHAYNCLREHPILGTDVDAAAFFKAALATIGNKVSEKLQMSKQRQRRQPNLQVSRSMLCIMQV